MPILALYLYSPHLPVPARWRGPTYITVRSFETLLTIFHVQSGMKNSATTAAIVGFQLIRISFMLAAAYTTVAEAYQSVFACPVGSLGKNFLYLIDHNPARPRNASLGFGGLVYGGGLPGYGGGAGVGEV